MPMWGSVELPNYSEVALAIALFVKFELEVSCHVIQNTRDGSDIIRLQ
jgi:hypothetical protein